MLNLKPNPKPKLMLPLMLGTDTMAVLTDITGMAEDTMVDTTDTVMDTDTDTTMKKLLQNSYLDPIVIKNSQKMPLSKK